ncbi:MAG: hypothetical protein DWH87_03650 [Planctomycetota bacterium]|nr:MAG: hypothetical protein DWH87_03650 [Planctomycetota bacterium]
MMQASHDRWVRPGVAGAMVCGWAILLAVVMASIQRMPVPWAIVLTAASFGVLLAARRGCPGILTRGWMLPVVLLLILDVVIIWEAVLLFDEKSTPAARAKEAETRRKAAAAE